MTFLANENFPRLAVDALRDDGHDVLWARTDMPGAADAEVLARAMSESRVLLTFDKDFGELAVRSGLPATCGIILFRLVASSPDELTKAIREVLASRSDWSSHFSTVEPGRIRMRPLLRINP